MKIVKTNLVSNQIHYSSKRCFQIKPVEQVKELAVQRVKIGLNKTNYIPRFKILNPP